MFQFTQEVDISTLCFLPTLERLTITSVSVVGIYLTNLNRKFLISSRTQYMEFSYPVAIESYKFMVPKPDEESRLWGPIRPFQYSVSYIAVFKLFLLPTSNIEILNCRFGGASY